MGRVVVMGSLIVDLVARTAHLPGPERRCLALILASFLGERL